MKQNQWSNAFYNHIINRVHEIFRQVHLMSLVSWFPQHCTQATKSRVARRLVDILWFWEIFNCLYDNFCTKSMLLALKYSTIVLTRGLGYDKIRTAHVNHCTSLNCTILWSRWMFQLVKKLKVAGLLHVIELCSGYLLTPPHPYLIINLSGVTKCQIISHT